MATPQPAMVPPMITHLGTAFCQPRPPAPVARPDALRTFARLNGDRFQDDSRPRAVGAHPGQRPRHTGGRFSVKARGPSCASSEDSIRW